MQFITTGNRIAVENFTLGDLYTITFTNGTYINSACIGIGENFVSFQRNEPELLFSLTMATAELVSSIDLYAGGSGTNNYNDLTNKPQINDVELVGNKSLSDLGIQATISDIDTIRAGAAAGATAVQPADMTAALATKQDALSSAQLDAVNSGITSTDVAQITTNKNNISLLCGKTILNEQANTSRTLTYTMKITDFGNTAACGVYMIYIVNWSTTPSISIYTAYYSGGVATNSAVTKIAGADATVSVTGDTISVTSNGKIQIIAMQ